MIQRLLAVLAGLVVAGAALAQAYPEKPIRIVVPFPPGGVNDIVARLVGAKLQERWGQSVIVDNRPGANSIIGNDFVAKSAPDGYTLLVNAIGGMAINPLLYPKLPYDALQAFTPVSLLVDGPMVLAVNAGLPVSNLQQFIEYARANPGKLNNSAGSTTSQVAGELFKQMTGVSMAAVPYKGSAAAVQGVAAGETQMVIVDTPGAYPHLRSGKVRGLALASNRRLASLPEVPTFAEAGLPAYSMSGWVGLFAPAGTPSAVVSRLSAEMARVMQQPDMREKLGVGTEPVGSTPEVLALALKADLARYASVIKQANMKAE